MSEVFEGYERQYCEISASLSRKCAAASALDGEKKKQKLSEIQADVQESELLIRKMDLEARSLQPSVKAGLLAKLREYKSDLSSVKSEVKRVSAPNAHQATREELLEAGMSDTLALQLTFSITCPGVCPNELLLLLLTVTCVDDYIGKSKKILASMSKRMDRNKWIVGGIIAALIFAILFILYFKFAH
ncbi:hypothetical protein ACQ4PT_022540 [Festuca glaucescens]